MNKENYIAFIPVRGGSKSIPLKNIKPINGRPLVYWTIDAAVSCAKIDKVYVSTDSQEIRDAVELYQKVSSVGEKLVCVERDPQTATDTATTESAMLEFAEKQDFGHMILIQATSPMLEQGHLSEAIELYEKKKYDSMLSVVRQKRFIWEARGDQFLPQNYDYLKRPRRQEFDGYLVENGAFYITSKERLLDSKCRISGKIGTYEMNEDSYFEIDEVSDWIIVEKLLRKKMRKKETSHIRLLATDCDGVLTDGGMYYTENGDELKKFNTKDGMGFALLKQAGIKTAIITGEDTQIVVDRAKKMQVDYLYKGIKDKLSVLKEIAEKENLSLSQIAYIGDDINDIECLEAAGVGISVPNAVEAAKNAADIVVEKRGGQGAVREAIDYILG